MSGKGTSYRALDWAWKQQLPPTAKLVLINLAGRIDQAYSCYPSLTTICEDTGLSRSSVTRTLNLLEDNDLLMRASRQRANGSTRSNRYYLNHPEAPHVTGEYDDDDDDYRAEELAAASARVISKAGR